VLDIIVGRGRMSLSELAEAMRLATPDRPRRAAADSR
jgi:hypothetical protein